MNDNLKITKLISDNGKEFDNQFLKEFIERNKIIHEFVTPYYHQGNGRIERANRTIRNALKKTKGMLKIKLKKIIENYNLMIHRAIGLAPSEARKKENWKIIEKTQENYAKEFKEKKHKLRDLGEFVLIKNEKRKDKMDDEFTRKGKISKILEHNAYEVLLEDGSVLKRHSSQLRKL